MEVAKSRTIGAPPLGTPTANGLVDMRRSTPPNGATSAPTPEALTKWTDTMPAAAARSGQSAMRPRWLELRSPTTETPPARAFSTPRSTACSPTVWPKPNPPSTTAKPGASRRTSISRPGRIQPRSIQSR